ncbi:hypothetical protein K7I13_00290 [Brucepastera parasyntrophica]|uniref:hypothetical protein n=1 Tax=Brucepastera parasyntrophica TaxID=2880008 RepID=UPI00210B46BB|nr:hypothetical protein [Brucepastera parasyntrophica]ULQ59837.1 hypothetical protein K7I13_00290 [Brucepastera parasyntrophica]
MIGFFIKKAFYDGWDHLLSIFVLNLLSLAVIVGGIFLTGLVQDNILAVTGILVLIVIILSVIMMATSIVMAGVADYKSFSVRDFFTALKNTWMHGVLYGILLCVLYFIFSTGIRYYLAAGGVFGYACAGGLFWIAFAVILSLQWFLPVRSQLDTRFFKCLKKSFIICLDNIGFSVFMFFYSIVLLLFSFMLITFLAGLVLAQNEAFKLRMYKYDWLEQQDSEEFSKLRKSVPWSELIAEDMEIVGTRSLRNLIFPWKD